MGLPFPSPTVVVDSRTEVFLGYLDYFRSVIVDKLEGLPDSELRTSRLPSGWTPLELLKHLTHVEMRWLVWGFEGCDVAAPWGDNRDGRWYVAPDETLTGLLTQLQAQAEISRGIVRAHVLSEVGSLARAGTGPIRRRSNASCSTCCRSTPATPAIWTSSASWQMAGWASSDHGRLQPCLGVPILGAVRRRSPRVC